LRNECNYLEIGGRERIWSVMGGGAQTSLVTMEEENEQAVKNVIGRRGGLFGNERGREE
jgi:hypothetical protein